MTFDTHDPRPGERARLTEAEQDRFARLEMIHNEDIRKVREAAASRAWLLRSVVAGGAFIFLAMLLLMAWAST